MALPLPRIIPDKDIQKNFDELANQFPVQAVNIGAGQIKAPATGKLIVPVPAGSTSYTFEDLNGNVDLGYEITVIGKHVPTGVGANTSRELLLQPNADSATGEYTNNFHRLGQNGGAQTYNDVVVNHVVAGITFVYYVQMAGTVEHRILGTATIMSGQDTNEIRPSTFQSTSRRSGIAGIDSAAGSTSGFSVGESTWFNTTDNITSLKFVVPNGTFSGTLTLERLGV